MDFFGIGNAIYGAALIYFRASRGTGRTTALIDGAKDGDRIVFATEQEARRIRYLLKDRGVQVDCVVIPIEQAQDIFRRGTPTGRTIFDHTWVERFYLKAIEDTSRHIDMLQRESSGQGSAHVETRMAARTASIWPIG